MSWSGIREAKRALKQAGDKKIAEHSAGFFQAFPGGYGEGDRFHGIRVPVTFTILSLTQGS